ncbi:unnamed protein product, partial [Rotaria sp. Silwood2]
MSPTFSATDALIRDYESKALFWFRWATAGECLDHALAIEFAREAHRLALLDIQKKPLDVLKHSFQQISGKE